MTEKSFVLEAFYLGEIPSLGFAVRHDLSRYEVTPSCMLQLSLDLVT